VYDLTPAELQLAEVALRWLFHELRDEVRREQTRVAAEKLRTQAEQLSSEAARPINRSA
jgi:hypothetical protein